MAEDSMSSFLHRIWCFFIFKFNGYNNGEINVSETTI
jgi:hypothetical protein